MKPIRSQFFKMLLCALAFVLITHSDNSSADISTTGVTTREVLRIGSKSDILSLDPHAISESLQLDVLGNIYESLVGQDVTGKPVPVLAKAWKQISPHRWRFQLREQVIFDQGEAFDADDVLFNYERARQAQSGIQVFVGSIDKVVKIDGHTVEFILKRPTDKFPKSLSFWYMISSRWCQKISCTFGVTEQKNDTSLPNIAHVANGTGPFRLVERHVASKSLFEANPRYWSHEKPDFQKIQFSVIRDDAARAKQLFQKEIDISIPFPLESLIGLKERTDLRIEKRAEARVLYLGFDLSSEEINLEGKKTINPLRDLRVRRAIQLGLDFENIHQQVMFGFSKNLSLMIPSGVIGYDESLDNNRVRDPARAKALLTEAGFPNGFSLELDCSNDRYLNDAQICQAIASDLSRIGIKVASHPTPKAEFFKKVFEKRSHFYLLGAATNSGDGFNIIYPVLGSVGEDGRGELNFSGYHNPRIDTLLDKLRSESDIREREEMFSEVLRIQQQELPQIPLHQQVLLTGLNSALHVHITPENGIPWKLIKNSKD